jgi:hypothetical protein
MRGQAILGCTLHKRQAVSREDGSTWSAVITLVKWDSDVEIIEMVYRPGTDNSEEIDIVRHSLESVRAESVRAEYERGEYRYYGGEEDHQARKGRALPPSMKIFRDRLSSRRAARW